MSLNLVSIILKLILKLTQAPFNGYKVKYKGDQNTKHVRSNGQNMSEWQMVGILNGVHPNMRQSHLKFERPRG